MTGKSGVLRPEAGQRFRLDAASGRAYRGAMRALVLSLLALGAASAAAQAPERLAPLPPDTTAARYGSSGSLVFVLTEYGLGLGGAMRARLTDDLSFVTEVALGAGRDEREQRFFVGFFGDTITPFKRNYVLLLPLHVGLEHRLFREAVEDNFRPFVHLSAGPTLGYQWPYFDDADGDGRLDEGEERLGAFGGFGDGEARLGVGGTVAVGAFFGRGRRTTQALRFGLQGTYFPVEVDLLEIDETVDRPSRRQFWTPVVSFHVGRLL
ncbi:MAG: hypothetical protein AAGJ11_08805 [Bacteroidota bacterium]